MIGDITPYPANKDPGVEWLAEVPVHWTIEGYKSSVPRLIGICSSFGLRGGSRVC